MAEYSKHQQNIIRRYYDNRQSIALQKLSELVSELYLAENDKKRDQLWKRVATHLENLKAPPSLSQHILARRDPAILAANLEDWLVRPPR
ncbi:MAG: hypothetical protein BIFFINMI_01770 [Phycisphaerae bacterium]|nr:hypothetical protein [Phycisphaerae bacterium]